MPLGEIIEKSFKYPWKNKGLWFYGVLIAIFAGGGSNLNNSIDQDTFNSFQNVDFTKYIPYIILGVILAIGLGVLGAILSSWGLAAISKAVPQIDAGKSLNRKEMGKTGKKVVWNLIKLNYLLPLAIVLAFIALTFVVVLFLSQLPQQTAIMVGLALLIFVLFAMLPIIIYFGVLWNLATRSIVLEDSRVFEGFKQAKQVIKGNFWYTLLFAVIMGLISGSVAIFFVLPFIAVVMVAVGGFASKIYVLVGIGVIIGILYLLFYLVVLGFLQAAIHTGWTLWWLELKKVKAAA